MSIDGTKIDANASKIRSVRYDRAQELRTKLASDIADLTAKGGSRRCQRCRPPGLARGTGTPREPEGQPGCRLCPVGGEGGGRVELDYVIRPTADGWKAVDVLSDGTISQVAAQRSDFRSLLASGGVAALRAGLERKVATLSGGTMA